MAVLLYCEAENLGFIPWFPLATGDLATTRGSLAAAAERLNATPSQVALAWLSAPRSCSPIPGTSTVKHLEENTGAAMLQLDEDTGGSGSPSSTPELLGDSERLANRGPVVSTLGFAWS